LLHAGTLRFLGVTKLLDFFRSFANRASKMIGRIWSTSTIFYKASPRRSNAVFALAVIATSLFAWRLSSKPMPPIAPPAPIIATAVKPVIAASKTLDLKLEPFIETINPARVELGRMTDFSTSRSPADSEEKPRFDLRGHRVLTVETTGPTPSRDIIFFYHWYNKAGTSLGVRDSYHMLRAAIDLDAEKIARERDAERTQPAPRFTDTFTGIPSRIDATQTAFYLQDQGMRSGSKSADTELVLYGHDVSRDTPSNKQVVVATATLNAVGFWTKFWGAGDTGDLKHDVAFTATTGADIIGRGVKFRITGVEAVTTVRANHDLQTTAKASEMTIGAMLPQVVAYKTTASTGKRGDVAEFRTLYFHNADLVKLTFDPETASLEIDAYGYEFRERSTRGSVRHPDANQRRVHPNLGVVNRLPADRLSITHTRSNSVAFPVWQPNGHLASFAITEHADYVGVQQDMMTMYGGNRAVVSSGQGILGNKIPLTKSVFALGAQNKFTARTASAETTGEFQQPSLETKLFLEQLRKYKADGRDVEIGAHCISGSLAGPQRTSALVATALELMAEFKPVSWIDHGGPECLWESGWDPTSAHYIVPLLKKHKFKYFNALGDKYDGFTNMIADNEPSNLLFHSIGLDDDLNDDWKPLVFNTVPLGLQNKNFMPKHIRNIIRARGLINIHTYLPYESLQWEQVGDAPPTLMLNPWYNEILGNLAAANKAGDLYLATNQRLNDFIWQVRALGYYTVGTSVHLVNPNNEPIKGLTIATRDLTADSKAAPTIGGVKVLGKRTSDGTTYRWFDLPGRK
jgi:hypothetical protein